jgi:hypothetical protein
MSDNQQINSEDGVSTNVFYDAKNVDANDISRMASGAFIEGLNTVKKNIQEINDTPVDLTEVDLPENKEIREKLKKDLAGNIAINQEIEYEKNKETKQRQMSLMQAIASKVASNGSKSAKSRFDQLLEKGASAGLISRQTELNKKGAVLLMGHRFWDEELVKQEGALKSRLESEYFNRTGMELKGDPLDVLTKIGTEDADIISDILLKDEQSTNEFAKYMHATQQSTETAQSLSEFLKDNSSNLGEKIGSDIAHHLLGSEGKPGSLQRLERANDTIDASDHEDIAKKAKEMMENIKELMSSILALFGVKRTESQTSVAAGPKP